MSEPKNPQPSLSRPKQRIALKDLAAAPAGESGIAAAPAPLGPLASRIPATGDDPDALVGSELAGYMVLKKLAEGGMGVVYLAEDSKNGRKSAIKLLEQEYCKNDDVVERFKQEARAVNAIRHENIVDIFDFGTDPDGRAFIVMELLRGEALAARLERGRLSFGEALPLLEQSLRALEAAHDQGFAHRDLKPDNIWLQVKNDGTTQVKLLDFGIAKLHGGTMVGTPDYMSPEQIKGDADIDHRTDLYSMGIIIYQLFAGVTPSKDPPRLANLPEELGVPASVADIVDCLLAKQPKDRYAGAGDVIADLRAVAGDDPPAVALGIKARTVVPPRRAHTAPDGFDDATSPVARRPRVGPPAWLWPTVASVAVIAVVAVLVATRDRGEQPAAQAAPPTPDMLPIAQAPKPAPPPVDLAPLHAAVDEAKAARDEATAARAVVNQKLAAIDAATARGAADDEGVRAVEVLADNLAVAGTKLTAAAARAHDAAGRAHTAAGASPSPEAQALLAEADTAATEADKAAAGSADAVSGGKTTASAYAKAETGDPDMYLSAADAEIATGKLADAKRDLDKARAAYKKAGAKNASLDWSYAQLYDRMAQGERDATKRLDLLKKAKQSFDAFARSGTGARAKQAAARSDEIAEEIAGGTQ